MRGPVVSARHEYRSDVDGHVSRNPVPIRHSFLDAGLAPQYGDIALILAAGQTGSRESYGHISRLSRLNRNRTRAQHRRSRSWVALNYRKRIIFRRRAHVRDSQGLGEVWVSVPDVEAERRGLGGEGRVDCRLYIQLTGADFHNSAFDLASGIDNQRAVLIAGESGPKALHHSRRASHHGGRVAGTRYAYHITAA